MKAFLPRTGAHLLYNLALGIALFLAAPAWIPLVWEAGDFALVSSARVEGRVTYQVLRRFPAAAD